MQWLVGKAGNWCRLCDLPDGSTVQNPAAKQEAQVPTLGQEDALEEEMATHSRILA